MWNVNELDSPEAGLLDKLKKRVNRNGYLRG